MDYTIYIDSQMDIKGAQNMEREGDQEDRGAWVSSGSWAVIPDESQMDIKGAQDIEREGDQEDREAWCHLGPGPLYLTKVDYTIYIASQIIIIMEICKAPTLRLIALNKHTHIMCTEMYIKGAQNTEREGDQEDRGAWVSSGSWAVIHSIRDGH